MKILIIGSKGFIGQHCMAHFIRAGWDVTGAQREETADLKKVFSGKKFDVCINAAGSAHVDYSFEYPEKDFELNVSLVINLLGAIKKYSPACKFINFSSAAVYGNPLKLPVAESAETKPLSPYGYHKLLSENLLYEYYKFFNLKTCSLRVFSAYGPGLKKQLFWDLFKKISGSEVVNMYGTGNESRDFIFIDDLMTIVDLVILKSSFKGDIYNVAAGKEVLIRKAVQIFTDKIHWNGEVKFTGENKAGAPLNWKADITKISELGFVGKTDLETGIEKYVQWLKEGG